MKKLLLSSPVYEKFYTLSKEIQDKIQNQDVDFLTSMSSIEKLEKLIYENSHYDIQEGEVLGRICHYLLFSHNGGYIQHVPNTSEEIKILQSNVFGIFEILKLGQKTVDILNITTGITYTIVGEGKGSEKSLLNLQEGSLIISDLLSFPDGWYVMKNFYYLGDSREILILYKQVLHGVSNILEAEERLNMIQKQATQKNNANQVNYIKRLKKIIGNKLGKKIYQQLLKKLEKGAPNIYHEFMDVISASKKFTSQKIELLKENIISYLEQLPEQQKIGKKSLFEARVNIVMSGLFNYIQKENEGINFEEKLSKTENEKMEKDRITRLTTINPLYSNKTPEDFLRELDTDYSAIENLRFQQINEGEIEFYDGYTKFFTDEEKKIYEKFLDYNKKSESSHSAKYLKNAYLELEKLFEDHEKFFRVKGNHLCSKLSYFSEKYNPEHFASFSLSELEEDISFLESIDQILKQIDSLKPHYDLIIKNKKNILNTKETLYPIVMLLYRRQLMDEVDEAIKEDDEKGVVNKLDSIVSDYTISDFLIETRKKGNIHTDYFYDKLKSNVGLKEDWIIPIEDYVWKKYRKDTDITIEYLSELIDNILVEKKGKQDTIDYNAMGIFLLTVNVHKKQIEKYNFGNHDMDYFYVSPGYIYDLISKKGYKEKFKLALLILGEKL